jgi:hypothetical protein
MFGRGNWAVFGIHGEGQAAFAAALDGFASLSQKEAVAKARNDGVETWGINPYEHPRLDEKDLELDVASADFKLGDGVYGLWFCLNEFEDVTDPRSKQEGMAYDTVTKPFKFLKKEEKAVVEQQVQASAVASRRQFPVLVDFNAERVFALCTNADEIGSLREQLRRMGAETFHLAWQFGGGEWPVKFLNAVQQGNKFEHEMASRAEDLRRFRPNEIEKLEDRMLESIVSGYFAMSELETGQWAGLSTPAKIRLFKASEPSSEASVSTAFTLIGLTDSAEVVSASVMFQALDSKFTKKGEEKQYRTDLLCIDVNDKVNLSDAGCALLRGFDLPQFRKDMKRHGKDRGVLSVKDYWFEWLVAMKGAVNVFVDNVTETLGVDKKLGMLPYDQPEEDAE